MTLKLLAVGDIHLGRRPSRLPEALAHRARELGPSGAWWRAVEIALELGVDAVALAGDVVERDEDFYEGYRDLHGGVERLAAAGIRVLGVAGNHDVAVLPRLAGQIEGFHLVGAQGRWEAVDLANGSERLTLWGWSFPRRQVATSPLAGVRFDRRPGPNLGLLHCDRDQRGSPYAPVAGAELAAAGLDGWLLGHIHAPDALSADAPAGYLGSLTGMDPGEPGAHGPWLVTVEGGRIRSVEQQVLAPLRWERLALDVSDAGDPEAARTLLLERVRDLQGDLSGLARVPEAVGLRVELVGRTRFGSEILAGLEREAVGEVLLDGRDGSLLFVERVRLATRPEVALEDLARRNDPPGLLARRLLLLERPAGDPERAELLAQARKRLEGVSRDARWQALEAGRPDEETTAVWLRRSGTRLLERMLAQREPAA